MNFKTPFKVLTTAALIGTLSLSAVAPGAASAADKTVTAQAETPANFAIEKVVLVKGDSKISVSFDTYIDALGNETALNGYELAYVVAANGEVFALDTYVDFYEAGNTEEEVVEKLSKAGKTSEVTEVKDGAFNDGKLEPVEDTAATAKADLEKAVAAAKATEIKDAAAKAELTKAIEAAEKAAAKEDATKEELEAAKAELTKAVAAAKKADEEAAIAPKVESVTAINAKELQIKFNKAVNKADVVATTTSGAEVKDTLVDGAITIKSLDDKAVTANSALATLSEDGKTLTLKAQTTEVFAGRYDVKIAAGKIQTADKKDFAAFDETIKAEDKVAPKLAETKKLTATKYKVQFSEPVKDLGTVTFKLADGTEVAQTANGVQVSFIAGNDYAEFVIGSDVAAGKEVKATFVGLSDYAGNLVDPNPSTTTFTKGDKDGVAPTVTELKAVNNKTVELKFSEELAAVPTVKVGSDAATVTQDKTDKTKYVAKFAAAQSGFKAVDVTAFFDLSGEAGTAYSKTVDFDLDKVAPKFVSSKLEVGTDNAEYLVLTFDEDVTAAADLSTISLTGSVVKDYVTSTTLPVNSLAVAKLVVDEDNAKIARIKLADLVGSTNNEGSVYKLTLTGQTSASAANAIVDDISGNAGEQKINVEFTRGKDGVASTKAQATIDKTVDTNGIAVVNNNELTVAFEQELDGATATDIKNYVIDGVEVASATLNPVASNKQTVTLKLKASSNTATGARNVTINGVKAKNGLAMETYKTTESLKENVAPTVTSAVLSTPTTITLTLSEKVTATATAGEFVLNIGGKADTTVARTVTATAIATSSESKTVVLNLGEALTAEEAAKGLTLTTPATTTVKDIALNALVLKEAVTVAQ